MFITIIINHNIFYEKYFILDFVTSTFNIGNIGRPPPLNKGRALFLNNFAYNSLTADVATKMYMTKIKNRLIYHKNMLFSVLYIYIITYNTMINTMVELCMA